MDEKLARMVRQLPRKGAEAEPLAEFPLEDRAPERVADPVILQAAPKGRKSDLAGAQIESIGKPEAKHPMDKRLLPPLSLTPRKPVKRMLTFDAKRRDIVADREAGAKAEQGRSELAQAVAKMPMRWEK